MLNCVSFKLHQRTLSADAKKTTFSFKYTIVERFADGGLDTDSKNFTSDSGPASDDEEDSEEELVVPYPENSHVLRTDSSSSSPAKNDPSLPTFFRETEPSRRRTTEQAPFFSQRPRLSCMVALTSLLSEDARKALFRLNRSLPHPTLAGKDGAEAG